MIIVITTMWMSKSLNSGLDACWFTESDSRFNSRVKWFCLLKLTWQNIEDLSKSTSRLCLLLSASRKSLMALVFYIRLNARSLFSDEQFPTSKQNGILFFIGEWSLLNSSTSHHFVRKKYVIHLSLILLRRRWIFFWHFLQVILHLFFTI